MKGTFRGRLGFGGLGLLLVFVLRVSSHALVITPARTEIRMVPGTKAQVVLTALNDDKVEIQVDVSKKDWFIPEVNKEFTVDRWIEVRGPARFYLKPGESRKLEVGLDCPKELIGEVVGMTSFLYQTEQPTMVTPMISVSIYLIAAGTEKMSGGVTDLIVRLWNNQVNLSAKVHSTGNIHLRPSGRLSVLDSKGVLISETAVAEGQPTYPGRDAIYSGTLPATLKLSPGKYVFWVDLTSQDLKLQSKRGFKILADGTIQMDAVKSAEGTPVSK